MDEPERDRNKDRSEQSEICRAGDQVAAVAGSEGPSQHLALEADVEDAGPFGVEARQAGEQQGKPRVGSSNSNS